MLSCVLSHGYMERAVMCHIMWLHVPRPTWSHVSMLRSSIIIKITRRSVSSCMTVCPTQNLTWEAFSTEMQWLFVSDWTHTSTGYLSGTTKLRYFGEKSR